MIETNTAREKAFAQYLAQQWEKLDPEHIYTDRGGTRTFASLRSASELYEFQRQKRAATVERLAALSVRMRDVLDLRQHADHELHHACLEIMEWGGVEGTSSKWLRECCKEHTLQKAITQAVCELCAEPSPEEKGKDSVFANGTPMNSGMTKVYALARPENLVIYDGRVGAALGLFARRFLQTDAGRRYCMTGKNPVPDELRWSWGDGLSTEKHKDRRNPSQNEYKFLALRRSGPRADLRHAQHAWRASRILRLVRALIQPTPDLQDLERALFMIGYDVRDRKVT